MSTWAEFAAAEPELAARVFERFAIRKHKTMATVRADGSPRISGTEVEFEDGEVYVGVMPDSVKGKDLLRDPRVAIHSPTDDPPAGNDAGWQGEAKLAGRAIQVPFEKSPVADALRFRIDISEAVLTHLNEAGDRLLVESWHPGRGLERLERT